MNFDVINKFEKKIANFFGAPYGVAVDCCTHGLELSLILNNTKELTIPKQTYVSIPFVANKLGIKFKWDSSPWKDYYYVSENIIDAAVLWKKNSYITNTYMCISFQFRKHLNLGRGGMILCNDKKSYVALKKMSYDGRDPNIPWREQNINSMGYHYYMTPETAQLGLNKLDFAIKQKPKEWQMSDWPDLSKMDVFKTF